MTRIIEVNDCGECPEYVQDSTDKGNEWCRWKRRLFTREQNVVPDWCPLDEKRP